MLNNNLLFWQNHEWAIASGTTSSTQGGAIAIDYPDGYSMTNCYMSGYKIYNGYDYVVNGYADRVQILLSPRAIGVYTNHSSLINRPIKILLFK